MCYITEYFVGYLREVIVDFGLNCTVLHYTVVYCSVLYCTVQITVIIPYPLRSYSRSFPHNLDFLKVGFRCRFAWVVISKDFFEFSNNISV